MKKVTSQDVAARAGVSQSAVSLILNESDKVLFNEETRQRVVQAAQELGLSRQALYRRLDRLGIRRD